MNASPEALFPPPSDSGVALPETVVRRASETDQSCCVILAYGAIKGGSGLYSDHVAEFLLRQTKVHVHSGYSTIGRVPMVEYVSLSDQEAEGLCDDKFMMKLAANRAALASKNMVRVEKFARPEEVDEAMLQHFVSGMDEAPESSEKEKALVERQLKCDDQYHVFWSNDEVVSHQNKVFVNKAWTRLPDYGPGAEKQIVDAALETAKRSVLGSLQGFYRIKTLAPNVCRVTMVAQGSLGSSFTKQAMAMRWSPGARGWTSMRKNHW
ncbi:hypothetical protein TeGR_g3065 [Tetraparma gracilis]|uniref:Uncharacterized protein n=1 Tax=Tetraparma gracilis TaxID=2962635 RepID=A0ABQ6M9V9_9STRA|nr:hypothetical protein TeGR_g3065 [Tetraparma gracilis]